MKEKTVQERVKGNLSEDFMNRYLSMGLSTKIFGVPIAELSRDELIAVVAAGGEQVREAREEYSNRIDL